MLTKTATATFIRHYIEMVVVMFAGMIVLGLPGEAALTALGSGTSELRDDTPAVVFLGMAATMTIPMVAWMRYRGHRWQPTLEMAASMIILTVVAIALLAADVLGFGALMGLEHVAMLLGMLVAMLLRIDEYSSHAPTRSLPDAARERRDGPEPRSAGLLAFLGFRRSGGQRNARRPESRRAQSPRRCTPRHPSPSPAARRSSGSRPTVGSSRTSTAGRATRAVASDARACSPPESVRTTRSASSVSLTVSSASATRSARAPKTCAK
jgi:hypothetical protein